MMADYAATVDLAANAAATAELAAHWNARTTLKNQLCPACPIYNRAKMACGKRRNKGAGPKKDKICTSCRNIRDKFRLSAPHPAANTPDPKLCGRHFKPVPQIVPPYGAEAVEYDMWKVVQNAGDVLVIPPWTLHTVETSGGVPFDTKDGYKNLALNLIYWHTEPAARASAIMDYATTSQLADKEDQLKLSGGQNGAQNGYPSELALSALADGLATEHRLARNAATFNAEHCTQPTIARAADVGWAGMRGGKTNINGLVDSDWLRGLVKNVPAGEFDNHFSALDITRDPGAKSDDKTANIVDDTHKLLLGAAVADEQEAFSRLVSVATALDMDPDKKTDDYALNITGSIAAFEYDTETPEHGHMQGVMTICLCGSKTWYLRRRKRPSLDLDHDKPKKYSRVIDQPADFGA